MGLIRKLKRTLFVGGRRCDIPADYYLVSFPKCGKTWLSMMLGRCIMKYFQYKKGNPIKLWKFRKRGVPRVMAIHEDQPQWKTAIDLNFDKSYLKTKKIIFLTRDPRDAMLSNFFYKKNHIKPRKIFWLLPNWRHSKEVAFTGEMNDFLHSEIGGVDTLIRYYNIWAEQRKVPAKFILIRFEDMEENPKRELRRALEFIGLSAVPDSIVTEAVEYSYEHMASTKHQIKETDVPTEVAKERSMKPSKQPRERYKEMMTPEQIKLIEDKMATYLSPYFRYEPCAGKIRMTSDTARLITF